MASKYKWLMLVKFKNENASYSLLETFPPCATTYNNLVNCTICTDGKQHKMGQSICCVLQKNVAKIKQLNMKLRIV